MPDSKIQKALPKSVSKLLRVLDKNPNDLYANKMLGQYFVEIGDYEKSLLYFSTALLSSQDAENYYNLGVSLHHTKKIDDALVMYDECINLNPKFAEAYSNRAAIYREKYNFPEALSNYVKAIELKPQKIDEYLNFAVVLFNLSKFEDALDICNYTISKEGISERKLLLKCEILFILGRLDEVQECLNTLTNKFPKSPKVLWANACNDLLHGNFETGWQLYESRWLAELGLKEYKLNKPKWLGDFSIEGLTLLVHTEQGLGDTIHFCRYVKELKPFKAKVIFLVQPQLFELLKDLDDAVQVSVLGGSEPLPEFDAHIPLLSLPLALKTTELSIPHTIPYLYPSPYKSSYWRDKFSQSDFNGFKVGLVWNGGFRRELINEHARNERRNISLDLLQNLREVNAKFFSLQKGEPAESELKTKLGSWNGPEIINLMDEVHDFTDTAAIIDQLDLVISVDTSTAHLAGALGKKVWLINRVDSCWRWIHNRLDSPWYPTMRIYQQRKTCQWEDVIESIKKDLLIEIKAQSNS